ncbi:MAG: glutaredoxin 3 [Gammaproteobacteria bacterium]|nr:MAG: glutaredoxin 3 [Gammaproteobacteria bacterium]
MPNVRMYCTNICPFCMKAERLLNLKGVQKIQKILVDINHQEMENMIKITKRRTVPQIFIGDRHVGGYDDLVELDLEGELESLLC